MYNIKIGTKFSYTHSESYTEDNGDKGVVSATVIGIITDANDYGSYDYKCVETKDVQNAPSWGFNPIDGGFRFSPIFDRIMANFTVLSY